MVSWVDYRCVLHHVSSPALGAKFVWKKAENRPKLKSRLKFPMKTASNYISLSLPRDFQIAPCCIEDQLRDTLWAGVWRSNGDAYTPGGWPMKGCGGGGENDRLGALDVAKP